LISSLCLFLPVCLSQNFLLLAAHGTRQLLLLLLLLLPLRDDFSLIRGGKGSKQAADTDVAA
jgi:hypothetical protein